MTNQQKPDSDPWIKFEGGKCPIDEQTLIKVKMSTGREYFGAARHFDWSFVESYRTLTPDELASTHVKPITDEELIKLKGDILIGMHIESHLLLSIIARLEHAERATSAFAEPTHRHIKRGMLYRVIALNAEIQSSTPLTEGDHVAVYLAEDGKAWARPVSEFNDGRFEELSRDVEVQ